MVDAARPRRARPGAAATSGSRKSESRRPRVVLLVRARDRGASAQRPPCAITIDGAARERAERRLLARGRAVGRPGAQHDRAGGDVVRRRGRTPPRAPAPAGPTQATRAAAALSSAATRPATTPPSRAASSSRKTRPGEVRQRRPLRRTRRRPRSDRPGRAVAAARTRAAAGSLAGDDDERVAGDLARACRARSPRPARARDSGPTTPTRRPFGRARGRAHDRRSSSPCCRSRRRSLPARRRARAEPPPSASRYENRTGRALRPAPFLEATVRAVYLTVAGMPLILPAFSSLYCSATLALDRSRRPSGSTCRSRRRSTLAPKVAFVPPFERAALRAGDRGVHGDVDLLQRARHDVRAEVVLVGVDTDAEHLLRAGRIEDAETALAGDLELDHRALGDLVQRLLLALRLCDEVLGVVVEHLDARERLLRAVLVAGDVPVDRRDLETADRADRLTALSPWRRDPPRSRRGNQPPAP